ncbi:MAG: RNA pseudouridine synthase [Pseudolabrys sp.]|nr:RNA pseudouridine synthase [Pseudolabrys sp.]
MTPEEMLSRLLYRDGLMLVIDKPAGLSVHRGPKGGHSLEDYFEPLRFGLPRDPALGHRLDKDTSGCLVLGRHRKALALLGKLFKNGQIGKTYWAVVEGGPAEDEGRIDMPLGKLDEDRGWWMKPDPDGKPAQTVWKVMGRFASFTSPWRGEVAERSSAGGGELQVQEHPTPDSLRRSDPPPPGEGERKFTWLSLEPLTGRTHQLRVHCAEMGWPIVGDNIYGSAPRTGGPPLHLHARQIIVPISKNKPPVVVTAPAPAHMSEMLAKCGWTGEPTPDQPPQR